MAPSRIVAAILKLVSQVPSTQVRETSSPQERARLIASKAAIKAALVSGGLALPPGILGWATILPEIVKVWSIQKQMVSDIAGAFGKKANLTPETMMFCLFRHTAVQGLRDLVVRAGQRFIVRRSTMRTIQAIAERIGYRMGQRAFSKGLSRWLPILGAVGVGGYAYYDTAQVARTAIEFFSSDIKVEDRTDS